MKAKIFEKIGNVVHGFFDKRTKEEKFFSQKFNTFFVLEDYLFCAKMVDEGYVATPKEQEKLNNAIMQKLNKNDYQYKDIRLLKSINKKIKLEGLLKTVPILEISHQSCHDNIKSSIISKLLYSDKKIEQEDFILGELNHDKTAILELTKNFIMEYKTFFTKGLDSFNESCSQPETAVNSKNAKLAKVMYLNILMIKNNFYLPEEIHEIQQEFKKANEYIERKTGRDYRRSTYINKKLWEQFNESLNKYMHQDNNNNKEELLRQLKSYSSRKKSLSEEIKDLIVQEDYSVNNLPLEAKEKIENIQNLATKINTEDTKQFIETRLPSILKKYFSIDEEYRTHLKSVEGFNAQELMMQSLDNIERILTAKQQDNNYDLLSELSVEKRKLQMHKVV